MNLNVPFRSPRRGDYVLALPEHDFDAVPVPRLVEEVFENFLPVMALRIGPVEIRTTIEHPFWVDGRGWTAANLLVEGDRLRSHDGSTVVLTRIEYSVGIAKVYNMRIAEYHTYFVGETSWGFSVWTHNTDDCIPDGSTPKPASPAPGAPSNKLTGEFRGRQVTVNDNRINLRTGDPSVKGSGFDYALKNHGGAGPNSNSQFTITSDRVKQILGRDDVIKSPIRQSGTSGNYIREVDAGEIVGNLPVNKGGTPTSVITVITDVKGNLVNTFPGRLGRGATLP